MANLTQQLAAELQAAHGIIKLALNIVSGQQRQGWLDAVCQAGLDGEGITRANERLALIALARGHSAPGADGVARIAAERARQISQEGHLPAGDAQYEREELARAAACYALPLSDDRRAGAVIFGGAPDGWPWAIDAWKPGKVSYGPPGQEVSQAVIPSAERVRELVKAGALIAAAIDAALARWEVAHG